MEKKAFTRYLGAVPILLGVVGLLLFFSVLYHTVLRQAKNDVLQQLAASGEMRSRSIGNWMTSRKEVVGMLRTSIEAIGIQGPELQALFEPSVQEGMVRNTFVILIDGTYIDRANSLVPKDVDTKLLADFFLAGKHPDSLPAVDPIHISPLTGLPTFSVSAPLRNKDGRLAGVVGISYPLEVFSFFTSDRTGGFGSVVIFTGDDHVISPLAANGQMISYEDVPGIASLRTASIGKAEGTVEIDIDGKDHVFAFYRIRGSDWIFAASSPRDKVYSFLRPLQNLFVVFFAIAGVLGVYLLYRSWSHESYKNLSESDLLTEAGNRLGMERTFRSLRRKGDYPVTMMMCDMDNLKIINDNLGHEQGDIQIKRLAAALRKSLRASDEIFRLGGDEFAAILPGTSKQTAELLVARALRVIQERHCSTDTDPPLSASIGIAVAESEDEVDSLYHRADAAMYRIKEARKDAVTAELMEWLKRHGKTRKSLVRP